MNDATQKSIVRTIRYFSYFAYPLTAFEVWKWQMGGERIAFSDIHAALDDADTFARFDIREVNGFFGMGDVLSMVATRHVRLLDALRKFRKVARAAQFLGRLPWVEGIAVCNSLAFRHTDATSDIDLFVVTSPGRVWSVRLLATAPVMFFRQRPGECARDPLCLSFFVDTHALALETLKIGPDDPYLAVWERSLVPLVDHSGVFDELEGRNVWTRDALPNANRVRPAHSFRPRVRGHFPSLPFAESRAEALQRSYFPESLRSRMNVDTCVVVTDRVLKFHDNDRRAEILRATRSREHETV